MNFATIEATSLISIANTNIESTQKSAPDEGRAGDTVDNNIFN
nr:MAG TPA: hypothetical protein [Caudoviricetes sp.]